jgi:uncharacterized membrane protein
MNMSFFTNPIIIFAIAMGISIPIFFVVRLLLNLLYNTALVKRSFFRKHVEKLRNKGSPLIMKYGLIGFIIFVAIPFPGTGVYAATILSWILGYNWQLSLIAILTGALISNGVVVLSAIGITQLINLCV